MSENDLTPKHDAIHRGYATFGTDKASAARKASLIDAALNHLAFERSAACVLTAPDTDPEILVAIGTAESIAKIMPGAANKAAEEGGLPVCSVKGAENMPLCVGGCAKRGVCNERAAADRASRQVANVPSEIAKVLGLHEPVSIVCAVQAIKALMPVRQVADKAEVEPVAEWVNYEQGFQRLIESPLPNGTKLYATPPATTGASTICYGAAKPDQACPCAECKAEGYTVPISTMLRELKGVASSTRRGVGERVSDILALIQTYESKLPVGASTVLTDERILRISEETALNYVTDERRPDNSTIIEFARAIEREVAAQAGPTVLTDEWNRVREEFEIAKKLGARFCTDSAMMLVDALVKSVAAQAGQVAPADLHDAIIRLRETSPYDPVRHSTEHVAYQCGHRDARHAAAELATGSPAGQVAVPEGQERNAALDEAADLVEGCDKRATLRGIAVAIRQLKSAQASTAGERQEGGA